jgi:hypothetical protein
MLLRRGVSALNLQAAAVYYQPPVHSQTFSSTLILWSLSSFISLTLEIPIVAS